MYIQVVTVDCLQQEDKTHVFCSTWKENHTSPTEQGEYGFLSLLSRESMVLFPCWAGRVWFSFPAVQGEYDFPSLLSRDSMVSSP